MSLVNYQTEKVALPNGAFSMREYIFRLSDKLDDLKLKLELEKKRTERIERKNERAVHYFVVRSEDKSYEGYADREFRGIVVFKYSKK